jgi:hypothetical protein
MKIIGLLNFYDESCGWLAAAVGGFARVCDTIVAVDGAYRLFPGGRACSHPNQSETIQAAAEAGGAGCVIYRPNEVWYDCELGKRNQLIQLAGALGLTAEDWLMVFDADCHILNCDPALVRADLEATDLAVATYTYLDGKDFLSDAKLAEYVNKAACDLEWTGKTRDVFRYNPTLRVGPQHWLYSVIDENGFRKWVRGPESKEGAACDLGRNLVVYHRTADRARVRREAQAYYYKSREAYGVEYLTDHNPPALDEADVAYLARVQDVERSVA